MFDVLFPRHGAVLNHHHGRETAEGLTVTVTGTGGADGEIRVNGRTADYDGSGFSAPVTLTEKFNAITVEQEDARGVLRRELQVVWDRASFKRYNFFIDDHSFFLTDLAREKPRSLFDHFYLAFLQKMHREYGAKFTLNLFYRNDYDPEHFDLGRMPACWKPEWRDNADWLRLAFHSESEFPDRPYQNAPAGKLGSDFDRVRQEIERFAGPETLIAPVALHWAMARPEALHELTERGVTALEGQFLNPRTGIDDGGSRDFVCDVGYFVNLEMARYLEKQGIFYDFRHRLFFYRGDCTANLWTPEEIIGKIRNAADAPRDFISLASHEQYSFPHYFNYLPDHFLRIETCIRETREHGYRPVFFADGLMGNESWGKA